MKKILITVLMIAILVAGLFTLTGCTGKLEEITLKLEEGDENISATLGYSAKAGITVEEGYDESGKILSSEEGKWELKVDLCADTTYSDNKEYCKDEDGYKEIEFNGYKGYMYNYSDEEIDLELLLEAGDDDTVEKYISIELRTTDYENEVNMQTIFELEEIQTILKSIKYNGTEAVKSESDDSDNTKNAKVVGEFADRTDGISDKDGLIFIPSFDSPDESLYKAEQRNDNVGIDNYLWYMAEDKAYESSGIEVRIIPESGTYESIEEYIEDKGDMYHFSKETIAGTEYDVYTFGDPVTIEKYSKEISGVYMVGNRVVTFHYNMYAEVPNQELGDQFFKQIMDSVEYSKDFK